MRPGQHRRIGTSLDNTATARPLAPGAEERSGRPKVLLVEDDESQVFALTLGLEREGLAVTSVGFGRDALAAARAVRPDVVLLDLMLPDISGIDVCKSLRREGLDVPIIMLSSRAEELDVVVGIEVGADDYVAKPYRLRELVARIGALLRRRRERPGGLPARDGAGSVLSAGDVRLDLERHEVFVRQQPVELPLREFQMLSELLLQAGRVVTKEDLLDAVWGPEFDGDPRIVATLIGRLRTRIEADPASPRQISTIRGVGYRFNDRT